MAGAPVRNQENVTEDGAGGAATASAAVDIVGNVLIAPLEPKVTDVELASEYTPVTLWPLPHVVVADTVLRSSTQPSSTDTFIVYVPASAPDTCTFWPPCREPDPEVNARYIMSGLGSQPVAHSNEPCALPTSPKGSIGRDVTRSA